MHSPCAARTIVGLFFIRLFMKLPSDPTICVVGLGYVGLPLAVAFGQRWKTLGYDTAATRIAQLRDGKDVTRELADEELGQTRELSFTDDANALAGCNVFVIAVPTPIDENKHPDLSLLRRASEIVGSVLRPHSVVIYESTVYPGVTEDVCVPILEANSSLSMGTDFGVGYSPERINPGDQHHRLQGIVKLTSGSDEDVAAFVDDLYSQIVPAGTHRTSSIRVAEAAKVIENTQRDLNIALVNELSLIFDKLGLDTLEVLEAAGTKWNFLPFRPGLVGGHCIGVDPYYLTFKALQLGYHPEVILAGRRLNDGMGLHVAQRLVRLLCQKAITPARAKVLVLGLSFKENCADIRNTRVLDLVHELQSFGITVDVTDPLVDPSVAKDEYAIELVRDPIEGDYEAVVLAVAHETFAQWGAEKIRRFGKPEHVFFDVKSVFARTQSDARL